jgi:hypothetical protein
VKKNGKWSWVAACDTNTIEDDETIELIDSLRYVEEEE